MAKLALLIGVSEYEAGLTPLPGAVRDIEAMQRVLHHTEIGEFDQVELLTNPEPTAMQVAIETLFSSCKKGDLALLFFSGHGVKDESGRLYFATHATRKTAAGELIKATAVPASFVQDVMSTSRSKHQVVILDCCFSGAFAEGMTAKDDETVDVQGQMGGQGRAVLTSSTSTQYSFEQQDSDLSIYTHYIVEGMETGAADQDLDGVIAIEELHDYAQRKVREAAPAMTPKIYAAEEGFRIRLAHAPTNDPQLMYRREVERFAGRGEVSPIGRYTLDALRDQLGIVAKVAAVIEAEVFKPHQERQRKLQQYQQVLHSAIDGSKPLSDIAREDLKRLQTVLGLRNEDVAPLIAHNHQAPRTLMIDASPEPLELGEPAKTHRSRQSKLAQQAPFALGSRHKTWILFGGILSVFLVTLFQLYPRAIKLPESTPSPTPTVSIPIPGPTPIVSTVKAGPIANNADAKTKCPAACAAIDKTWDGGWVTTVWGKESVCNCKS